MPVAAAPNSAAPTAPGFAGAASAAVMPQFAGAAGTAAVSVFGFVQADAAAGEPAVANPSAAPVVDSLPADFSEPAVEKKSGDKNFSRAARIHAAHVEETATDGATEAQAAVDRAGIAHPLLTWQLAHARARPGSDTTADGGADNSRATAAAEPPQARADAATAIARQALAQAEPAPRSESTARGEMNPPRGETARASIGALQSAPMPLPDAGGANVDASAAQQPPPVARDLSQLSMLAPVANGAAKPDAPLALGGNAAHWGRELLDALQQRVEMQLGQQIKQVHIRLDPPELGRLDISLSLDADRLAVRIDSSHAAVRDALQQGGERLRAALLPQHSGGVDVNIGHGGERRQREQSAARDAIAAARIDADDNLETAADAAQRGWLNTLV